MNHHQKTVLREDHSVTKTEMRLVAISTKTPQGAMQPQAALYKV